MAKNKQIKWTNQRILDKGVVTKHFHKRWCQRNKRANLHSIQHYVRGCDRSNLEHIRGNYYKLENHVVVILTKGDVCSFVTYICDLNKKPHMLNRIVCDEVKYNLGGNI